MSFARVTGSLVAAGLVWFSSVFDPPHTTGRLDEAIRQRSGAVETAPRFAEYRWLRSALDQYRQLAAAGRSFSTSLPAGIISPGDQYADAAELADWLSAVGDFPTHRDSQPPLYDAALVDAVRLFQSRHGLTSDGILGPRTLAALRVTPAVRVHQIELAMERLRALPDVSGQRHVLINIPTFQAWAWDAQDPERAPALSMKVIVGQAARTETPPLVATMGEIVFRPSWNVPQSITRAELVPLIRKHPEYLEGQHMDVLSADGRIVRPAREGLIAKLSSGEYRLRQRFPGPDNALGLVKFVFPNDRSIYMHDTPVPELFARSRRDFSHGCVRVENPVALAEWALTGTAGWTRSRIEETMRGSATVTVTLAEPMPVIIFYATAFVDPADGLVHFADDLYGREHD